MATAPARIEPPAAEAPLTADTGQHTKPWADYHQSVSDRLGAMPALVRKGAVDGADAAAGDIGEYLTASFAPVALPDSVATDVGTLALTAGDWDVWGWIAYTSTTSNMRIIEAWVNTTPAAAPGGLGRSRMVTATPQLGDGFQLNTGTLRVSLGAPGTAYLGAVVVSSSGAVTAGGQIAARRVR